MTKKLVYVIDSEDTCELLKFVLDKHGYSVVGSSLSEDFYFNYNDQINSCILLDIKMPVMEGLNPEFMLKIKSPIVYMFNRLDLGYVAKGFRMGAINFQNFYIKVIIFSEVAILNFLQKMFCL